MASVRTALRLAAGAHPLALCALLTLVVGAAATPVAAAWFTKMLLDELSRGAQAQGAVAIRYALLAAGLMALTGVASRLTGYLTALLQTSIGIEATVRLNCRVNTYIGLGPFENPRLRDRLVLAQQAAEQAPFALLQFGVSAVQSLITVTGFAGVLMSLWWPAGLLVLATLVPELFIQLALARRTVRAAEQASGLFRVRFLFQGLLTDLRAVREIRLYQLGAFFHGRMTHALRRGNRIELDAQRHAALVQAAWSLASATAAAAGTVAIIMGVVRGKVTLGDLTLFIAALGAVQSGLSMIVQQLGEVSASVRLFAYYVAVVQGPLDLADGHLPAPALRHGIHFEDVWFRYDDDGPWVLRGVSLTLPAGTAIGLVGVNGAGKSTLVKLLCRFYDPQQGRITWDGTDLRDLAAESLRARMGAVFQDFMCYDLTAEENVGIGRLPYKPEEVQRAAELAEVHEPLTRLPQGFRTMLSRSFTGDDGETGVNLSGGQWQRIALARSFMRAGADLLILDEPSSGLDAEAEVRIHESLTRIRHGSCGLLISHRLSTLRGADRIVVLDGGRIAESGHHDELLAAGGVYARLFTLQAHGYQMVSK